MRRDDIVKAAQGLVDTPFRKGGRQPGFRLDCIGVLLSVADAVRYSYITLPPNAYGLRDPGKQFLKFLRLNLDEQPRNIRDPGDIIAMIFADNTPQHAAIISRPGWIVHAYIHARKVVETPIEDSWHCKISHSFRFRGLEDRVWLPSV
jgi:cell wall-associated NlpC family hydrolase